MKLEKKQIVILVSVAAAVLVLAGGAWIMISSRPNTAAKPTNGSRQSSVAPENTVGISGNDKTAQEPVAEAPDTSVVDVKTKAEATKAIGDLDALVDSAGNDTE
jgi:hypothetical protein